MTALSSFTDPTAACPPRRRRAFRRRHQQPNRHQMQNPSAAIPTRQIPLPHRLTPHARPPRPPGTNTRTACSKIRRRHRRAGYRCHRPLHRVRLLLSLPSRTPPRHPNGGDPSPSPVPAHLPRAFSHPCIRRGTRNDRPLPSRRMPSRRHSARVRRPSQSPQSRRNGTMVRKHDLRARVRQAFPRLETPARSRLHEGHVLLEPDRRGWHPGSWELLFFQRQDAQGVGHEGLLAADERAGDAESFRRKGRWAIPYLKLRGIGFQTSMIHDLLWPTHFRTKLTSAPVLSLMAGC